MQSFLRPVFSRPNLDVLTGATVTRLIFQEKSDQDPQPLTADAVEFIYAEQTYRIDARREVILCAGYGSVAFDFDNFGDLVVS